MNEWQPIKTAPANTPVIVHYKNALGNSRTVKAEFVPRFTRERTSKNEGNHYWLEGWYEMVDNWDNLSHIRITGVTITHWMPLPKPPMETP